MLPNVQAKDWSAAFHQGTVLVGGAFNDQLAAINAQPCPATTEASARSSRELFLEGVETAKFGIDRSRQVSRRTSATTGREDAPEQAVIGMTATVVSHGTSFVIRNGRQIGNQILDRLSAEIGPIDRCVHFGDIAGVVLAVMNFHRLGINVGLKRILGEREFGKFVSHDFSFDYWDSQTADASV